MQINYKDQTCDFEVIFTTKLSHDDEVSLKNKYTGYNSVCENVQYSAHLSFVTILSLFIYNFVLLLH